MNFYETLTPYYDELFPFNPQAGVFLKDRYRGLPGSALDAGCATGSQVLDLAREGWIALGLDLCGPMIALARAKALAGGVTGARFAQADMTNPECAGELSPYSLVLCLGNTLPHLDAEAVCGFLDFAWRNMKSGGLLVVQTLNYANPEIGAGFVFPNLSAEGVEFRRRYEEAPGGGLSFVTEIETRDGLARDRTSLHPLKPSALAGFLAQSGFGEIEFSGGWDGHSLDMETDRYLIASARR